MLAVLRQVVIHPRDVGIPREMNRGVKAETLGIQTVPRREVIWNGILFEDRQDCRIRTFVSWIKRYLSSGVQSNDLACGRDLMNDAISKIQTGYTPQDHCI